MRKFLVSLVAIALTAVAAAPAFAAEKKGGDGARHERKIEKLKLFIDVHDRGNTTFPAKITREEFAGFFAKYEAACREEGVILLRIHVSLEEGRAYCFTAAPSADAVRRAHERVGLPYDGITEVATVTPADMFPAP
jgi:hypothetical protein